MKAVFITALACIFGSLGANETRVYSVDELVSMSKERELDHFEEQVVLQITPRMFKFEVNGENPLFNISSEDQTIEFKEQIYVKTEKDDLKFSFDGSSWKNFEEFFTGSFSVGFSKDNDEEPKFYLSFDFKKRD